MDDLWQKIQGMIGDMEEGIRREIGDEKFRKFKSLQNQALDAMTRGDVREARRLEKEIEVLHPRSRGSASIYGDIAGDIAESNERKTCPRCSGKLKAAGNLVMKCEKCGLNICF